MTKNRSKKEITYKENQALYSLKRSLEILIVGEGNAKSRVKEAYSTRLILIDPTILPRKLARDLTWIKKKLHSKAGRKWSDSIQISSFDATIRTMKNATASKIARRIYELHRDMADYVRAKRASP